MSPFSHLISILLSIGAFLGLPYNHPLPTLPPHVETHPSSTIPALTEEVPVSPTSTTSPKKKLSLLILHAPVFTPISIPRENPPLQPTPPTSPLSTLPSPQLISTLLPQTAADTPISQIIVPKNPSSNPNDTVVNIFCTTRSGNTITAVTGSGIIIDSRGVILTNAHVAEHVLITNYLSDPNKNCVIRQGSPALALYKVKMLYLPESWLREHGEEIYAYTQSQESGAGDYALMAITGSESGNLPQRFSYASPDISTHSLGAGTAVLAVSYPAGDFASDHISIITNYGFGGNLPDLIRTGVTDVAERGASGGGIFNERGNLIGLIATTIRDGHGSGNDLQALTLYYIDGDMKRATHQSLGSFLSPSIASLVANFKNSQEENLLSYLPH